MRPESWWVLDVFLAGDIDAHNALNEVLPNRSSIDRMKFSTLSIPDDWSPQRFEEWWFRHNPLLLYLTARRATSSDISGMGAMQHRIRRALITGKSVFASSIASVTMSITSEGVSWSGCSTRMQGFMSFGCSGALARSCWRIFPRISHDTRKNKNQPFPEGRSAALYRRFPAWPCPQELLTSIRG